MKTFKKSINGILSGVLILTVIIQIIIALGWGVYVIARDNNNSYANSFIKTINKYAPRSTIYFFSISVSPAFPVINYTHSNWPSRFNGLWMMPYLVKNEEHPGADYAKIKNYLFDSMSKDLSQEPPALILVDDSNPILKKFDKNFDYIDYFKKEPRFESFWKNYRFIDNVHNYKVFCRIDRCPVSDQATK